MPVLLFMATADNSQYLGEASTEELAHQVVNSRGANGHNVEYVTRLADYIRRHIPKDKDAHLFDLDTKVRNILNQRSVSVESLYSPLMEIGENLRIQENVEKKKITNHESFNPKSMSQLYDVSSLSGSSPERQNEELHRLISINIQ